MRTIPSGYRLYADVVSRLDPVRADSFGLTCRCPFEARHRSRDRHPSLRVWVGDKGLLARCYGCGVPWPEIVEWVGLPVDNWFSDRGTRNPRGPHKRPAQRGEPVSSRIVATYDYRDPETGVLLYQKVRLEPKSFRFRRPLSPLHREAVGIKGDAEAWGWGLGAGVYRKAEGTKGHHYRQNTDEENDPAAASHSFVTLDAVSPVLYRLPELYAAPLSAPVFFVEGEKCADLLFGLGFTATCGPHGASAWQWEWARHLAGRRLVIIPDNDNAGMHHAHTVVASCLAAGCASVRLVWPSDEEPGPPYAPGPGEDVGDWLRTRFLGKPSPATLRQAVIDLCRAFPEYARRDPEPVARPATTTQPEAA